ncbi:MAG: hypothetical protein IJR17_00070 [Clostridia bacterium]|nr:hypothetical protein [Clostridia bacterium]
MFEDCGEKIKKIAVVCFVLSLIASIGLAIFLGDEENSFWIGALVFVAGCVVSYIESLLLYGFGCIVENNETQSREHSIIASGGWRCVCGCVNYAFDKKCRCGKSKDDLIATKE